MAIITKRALTLHGVRVIDSDTIEAWTQVSPRTRELWTIRLVGVEGGELDTREGLAGRQTLINLIHLYESSGLHFVGNDTCFDKYGRHVGDVGTYDGKLICGLLLTSGTHWRRNRKGDHFPRPASEPYHPTE